MLTRRLYYCFKPYLPWRLRMPALRLIARNKLRRVAGTWPINEAAGSRPADWPGWPDGKQFALVLTHDVESPAGLAKCRKLMQIEQSLGFRSSFNFIPEGDYSVSQELREALTKNGFEVGVHDLHHDGKLYESRKSFSEKARRINEYLAKWDAVGFRSGFMLHNLEWLQDLNVNYDASTFDTDPFEPQPDAAGTIFPFWVPRPDGGGYVELPYTLPQDSTLFLVLQESSPEIWLRKLDWIAARGGMALLNIHPDYMQFDGEGASSRMFPAAYYREFLEVLHSRYQGRYWHPLPKQMAAYAFQHRTVGKDFGHRANDLGTETTTSPQTSTPGMAHGGVKTTDRSSIPGQVASAPVMPAEFDDAASHNPAGRQIFSGKRAAVVLFSHYPADPRPCRAAEALAADGMAIDLICLQWNHAEPRQETVNGVNVFRVPLKRRRGGKLVYIYQYLSFCLISFGFLMSRSIRKRYDLVHVHNMPDFLVFSTLVPKILGAKVILDLHDPTPELMVTIYNLKPESRLVRATKLIEKWSIGFANLVLTPNISFKNLFTSRSCPAEKIHILMNSPQAEFFPYRPVSSEAMPRAKADSFVILYHGSLVARHGLGLAIDALELVRKTIPNATITICGESTPYFEQVMESVRARGMTDAVRYLGMRNLRQIAEAIETCHLGIIPNLRSVFTEINMPTRIFEYLALGKPVIAPRTRGIQDYYAEDAILYFTPNDTADLADKMIWAFNHSPEMMKVIQRGQAIYLQHRWVNEREQLISLVKGLLKLPSGQSPSPHQSETK